MGGSGGSGGGYMPTGGAGGGSPSGVDCILQFEARIHGPVPEVANALEVGDTLAVRLIEGPPIRLGLFRDADLQVGTLAGQRELARILECLQGGHSYVAEVVSSEDSLIMVQVRNE